MTDKDSNNNTKLKRIADFFDKLQITVPKDDAWYEAAKKLCTVASTTDDTTIRYICDIKDGLKELFTYASRQFAERDAAIGG